MRILITLATAVVAAAASLASGASAASSANAGGGGVDDGLPCRPGPGATVWTRPLAAAEPDGPTVLRGFEPPLHRWDAGHRGIDLAGSVGAPVVSAGEGTVLFAGRVVDQGVVVVGHGALRTSYEPVDAGVAVGARVATGQVIGRLDSGHCAGTACLHWGLLSGRGHATVYYDPLLLLGCGGVRLEPLNGAGIG